MHLDHGGNVGKFPKSTLVVQKDEIKNAFWPEPGTAGPYIPGDFMMLRNDLGRAARQQVQDGSSSTAISISSTTAAWS